MKAIEYNSQNSFLKTIDEDYNEEIIWNNKIACLGT